MDLPQQRTNTAVHAAPGQQVYVTVDTGGHMASPAQVYFDQVSLKKNSLCSFLRFVDKGVVSYALKILIRLIRQRQMQLIDELEEMIRSIMELQGLSIAIINNPLFLWWTINMCVLL